MSFKYGKRKYGKRTKETWSSDRKYRTQYNITQREQLTGVIQGKDASDLEERVAKSLDLQGVDYIFEWEVDTAFQLPGEGKKVDFLVLTTPPTPVEVDGVIGHTTQADRAKDVFRELMLNGLLVPQGFNKVVRLKQWQTSDQDSTDYHVRNEVL